MVRIMHHDSEPDRRAHETDAQRLQFLYDKFVTELKPLMVERRDAKYGRMPKDSAAKMNQLLDAIARVNDQATIRRVTLTTVNLREL